MEPDPDPDRSTRKLRLLVVNDRNVAVLAELLAGGATIEVVGQAASAAEAVTEARRLRPDAVLLDLTLPDTRLLHEIRSLSDKTEVFVLAPDPRKARLDNLSPQEKRVLEQVVAGRTNKEIARALKLSAKTVKNYLSNAFQKLRVGRRSHAAAVFGQL